MFGDGRARWGTGAITRERTSHGFVATLKAAIYRNGRRRWHAFRDDSVYLLAARAAAPEVFRFAVRNSISGWYSKGRP
jgi:hypothetical protein